ncbi:MAG: NirD/YgiW/YdeI family stress tolerance protein [Alphaproteobacteria bacterium]|nr:MAG: NirD/YgiW/YdeI family stress tolerance protein [Alphaproteobacteria bacterium]
MTRFLMATAMTMLTVAAFAQSAAQGVSVKAILDNPVDNQKVNIQGTLLSHVGGERYMFSDGTGQIQLEIDKDKLPTGMKAGERTRVEIQGEVDKEPRKNLEIDVDMVRAI